MENANWVGVDTHKNTLACYSRNDFKEFSTTDSGYKKALEWAGENAVFAIEGAYCLGRPFASYLINNKRKVYEINPFNPKVKGVIAKVEKLEDCPQDLLRFAKEHDLPIILMKATDRKFMKE